MSAPDPIVEEARAGDPERYLSALLAPEVVRRDLLAIAAFAAALRRIPAAVKEPMMGEIRLQWWRDVIAEPHNSGGGHAIADAIKGAMSRHRLSLPLLSAMTEARAFDLYDDPMPDAPAFEGYLDKTESIPFALALQVVGADAPAILADHAGRAYGRLRLLAALPQWLSRGRCPLPRTLIGDSDDLQAGRLTPAGRAALEAVASETDQHLQAATRLARTLPRSQRVALLPLATIRPYLKAFRKTGHDPLRTMTDIAPLTRVASIARAHWLGL